MVSKKIVCMAVWGVLRNKTLRVGDQTRHFVAAEILGVAQVQIAKEKMATFEKEGFSHFGAPYNY